MPDYLDTSAFVKLVRSEPESEALQHDVGPDPELISSALLGVEARRAARRYGQAALRRTQAALPAVTLLPVDDETIELAAGLEPPELRSLDALHLAAALSAGAALERFYCYDERLATAAAAHGLDVRAPS